MRRGQRWLLSLGGMGAALAAFLLLIGAPTFTAGATPVDDDHDGVSNVADLCPNTQRGHTVNEAGCAGNQDQDKDGVLNSVDKCPTQKGPASNNGCPKKTGEFPSCKPNKAIAAAFGVKQGNLLIGTKKVEWDRAPEAQPMNAFSSHELSSKKKLKSFLDGDSQGSRATRKLLEDVLSETQYKRALSGVGWQPVQFKGDQTIKLKGNYQLIDHKVVKRASISQPGEILWVYVPTNCTGDTGENSIDIEFAVRAWCGNPQVVAKRE